MNVKIYDVKMFILGAMHTRELHWPLFSIAVDASASVVITLRSRQMHSYSTLRSRQMHSYSCRRIWNMSEFKAQRSREQAISSKSPVRFLRFGQWELATVDCNTQVTARIWQASSNVSRSGRL